MGFFPARCRFKRSSPGENAPLHPMARPPISELGEMEDRDDGRKTQPEPPEAAQGSQLEKRYRQLFRNLSCKGNRNTQASFGTIPARNPEGEAETVETGPQP